MGQGPVQTVTIENFGAGGEGVARLESGLVVFVPGAIPGEQWKISVPKTKKRSVWARPVRLLHAADCRIKPDCPYYTRCGGCQYRHITYEAELAAKRRRVDDALQRIGGLGLRTEGILGAEHPDRYRNKCQFPVGADGSVGFYRSRSHEVTDVEDCLLQPETAALARKALKDWMHRFGVAPYDERSRTGLVRHLCVRTASSGRVLLCVVANAERMPAEEKLVYTFLRAVPQTAGILLNVNREATNVVLGREYRVLWGADSLEEELCGLKFRISMPSFFQVNREQTEKLYRTALDFAALTGSETVLDLYCGIGTISLAMASRALRVIGAEIVPEAVRNAEENARNNGVGNAEFYCSDAGEMAQRLMSGGLRPDVITLDPPRKGLLPGVAETVSRMEPGRIVYVSCDPATLARDLRKFEELGYSARKAAAVDLFPRTKHVETVVLMSRRRD